MNGFTILDGGIVGLYLLITMVVGIAIRKYVGKVEDFLVARRQMDVYLGIASLAATEFGIVTCMYAAQNGYEKGFSGAIPGILTFRPEASLMYFNVDHVCDTIQDRVRSEATPPKAVVLDLSAAPYVDMQSAHTLAGLADELQTAGVRLQVVEARSTVRDRLRAEAVDARLGGVNRFTTVADAVEAFQKQTMI